MLYEKFVSERRDLPFVYLCHKDVDLKPGIKYGPVIRDCFIIELCTSGVGSVIINGKEFPLKTGDCYFLFPGDTVIHTADIHNPRSGIWAAFDGIMIEDALKRGGISASSPFAPPECFETINNELETLSLLCRTTTTARILDEPLAYILFSANYCVTKRPLTKIFGYKKRWVLWKPNTTKNLPLRLLPTISVWKEAIFLLFLSRAWEVHLTTILPRSA